MKVFSVLVLASVALAQASTCDTHTSCEACLAADCVMFGQGDGCSEICPSDVACYQKSTTLSTDSSSAAVCERREADVAAEKTCSLVSTDCATCTSTETSYGKCKWFGGGSCGAFERMIQAVSCTGEVPDCTTREEWSDRKVEWCCTNKQLGCVDGEVPDCTTREEWSDTKVEWCCTNKQLGCVDGEVQDCTTREEWSDRKVEWCCTNEQLGCVDGEVHNCETREEWSDTKVEWCCTNKKRGCVKVAARSLPKCVRRCALDSIQAATTEEACQKFSDCELEERYIVGSSKCTQVLLDAGECCTLDDIEFIEQFEQSGCDLALVSTSGTATKSAILAAIVAGAAAIAVL